MEVGHVAIGMNPPGKVGRTKQRQRGVNFLNMKNGKIGLVLAGVALWASGPALSGQTLYTPGGTVGNIAGTLIEHLEAENLALRAGR